jgi:CheY-like chemotaxis protein
MADQTVMLVEDEPSIRQLMRRMLEGHGYTMLEAKNGADALSVAEDHRQPIDLLLTDVVMPAMDGFELAIRFKLLHEETRVLFLSGHAEDSPEVRAGLRESSHAFLLKPFTRDKLRQKIAEVINGNGA